MNTACIAVVDADPAILNWIELVLTLDGYRPAAFRTAHDATSHVDAVQPALSIIELHLERAQAGLDVVQALRHGAATAAIPIVLWSVDPNVDAIAARQHLDAVVVRRKPVLLQDLLRVVAEVAPADCAAPPSRWDVPQPTWRYGGLAHGRSWACRDGGVRAGIHNGHGEQ
jgi:DNA-binding NtrC family response regulator